MTVLGINDIHEISMNVATQQTEPLVMQLAEQLVHKQFKLACAESCTGGLLAKSCTDLSGSSHWFDRGFVTYSNESKQDMLGVAPALIATHGAVSEEVARAMATGVMQCSRASIGVAITGIAGPGGGSLDKPVGLVWFGFFDEDRNVLAESCQFEGDRQAVREQSVHFALLRLIEFSI